MRRIGSERRASVSRSGYSACTCMLRNNLVLRGCVRLDQWLGNAKLWEHRLKISEFCTSGLHCMDFLAKRFCTFLSVVERSCRVPAIFFQSFKHSLTADQTDEQGHSITCHVTVIHVMTECHDMTFSETLLVLVNKYLKLN